MRRRYHGAMFGLYQMLIRASGRNLGTSAIIADASGRQVLVVRSRFHGSWGFPGGGVQRGESIPDAIVRECREELGVDVTVEFLSGIYYVRHLDSHTLVFRCSAQEGPIVLSVEHSEYRYIGLDELPPSERILASDALDPCCRVPMRTLP
jgi:8-oxo-dGTP pyrophosphatase MutT (NUDIX family)